MKTTITVMIFALWLGGCASNQASQGSESGSAGEVTSRKKVCTRVRTNGSVTRSERVCKYVDVTEPTSEATE